MKELKFNSQICTTIEQSKRLLELGLKPETADIGLAGDIPIAIEDWKTQDTTLIEFPAWSLHRLIDIMNVYEVVLDWKFGIYECVISVLEERIKDGLINREYLKQ